MRGILNCAKCGEENDDKRSFCSSCGTYLRIVSSDRKKMSVWKLEETSVGKVDGDYKKKYVAICPQCKEHTEAPDGNLPLMCNVCGYMYQIGVDSVELQGYGQDSNQGQSIDKKKSQSTPKTSPYPQTEVSPAPGGPLRTRQKDETTLRLLAITNVQEGAVYVRENGDVLGNKGTIFQSIRTNCKLVFRHTIAGWYAKALQGCPMYGNDIMDIGSDIKLKDGDTFVLGDDVIQVEITEKY